MEGHSAAEVRTSTLSVILFWQDLCQKPSLKSVNTSSSTRKKPSQEPENKSDDAKKKEDWKGERAAGAGTGKDLQVAQLQEQSPHSEPLHNTQGEVPGAGVIQPAVNNSP